MALPLLLSSPVGGPAAPFPKPAGLRLPRIFNDGMVLQRQVPMRVWGWARANARVVVSLGDAPPVASTADGHGAWSLKLPRHRAGGPFRLVVRSNGDSLLFRDVLVGDVWVASGQSNMEFQVAQAANAAEAIASARDSTIREFKIPDSWSNAPDSDLAGGTWRQGDGPHVSSFSAVAYFYARHLRPAIDVPIGIINATWGGSNIETWISRGAQHLDDRAWAAIQQGEAAYDRAVRDSLRAKLGDALPEIDSGLVDGRALWADPSLDDRAWTAIRVPGYWEPQGYPSLDGIAWYRLTFSLDSSEIRKGGGASISLAAIDDDDITWLNGVEIGRTSGYNMPRSYAVPAHALRAGDNVLAVRVADYGGGGGINGAAALVFGDGARRPLAGNWKFKVARVTVGSDGQRINKIPSVLYNKMVHPILPYTIKGVLWYQGESNANDAEQAMAYRHQFATLVNSWRREWDHGAKSFPFLWVQLPGYGRPDSVPVLHPAWPLQRESMDDALSLPATGRAVAIDLGEADDIHPKDKEDVGARLALVGRRVAYGEHVDDAGPTFRSFTLLGDTAVVSFAHLGGGLTMHGNRLGGFALAAANKRLVWANAKLVGDRVYVWSDGVSRPVAVRYAWANNPATANLFGKNGLPAAPFRSDRW
jgi:sialate O-acetylesterase